MAHRSMIDRVARHKLPPEEVKGLVDVLSLMLTGDRGTVQIAASVDGKARSAVIPPAVMGAILDTISLMGSAGGTTVLVVDDHTEASSVEVCALLKTSARTLRTHLLPVGISRSVGDGMLARYPLHEVVEAFRRDRPVSADALETQEGRL